MEYKQERLWLARVKIRFLLTDMSTKIPLKSTAKRSNDRKASRNIEIFNKFCKLAGTLVNGGQ